MKMPTPEEFAAAPLFREVFLAPPAPRADYTQQRMVVHGLVLEQVPGHGEQPAITFRLEGVDVGVCKRGDADGADVWAVSYLDREQCPVVEDTLEGAQRAFGEFVERRIASDDRDLKAFFAANGVDISPVVDLPADGDGAYGDGDGDGDYDRDDDDLGAMYVARPTYGPPLRVVRSGTSVWIEGRDEAVAWAKVRDALFRFGEDGSPICSTSGPITSQISCVSRSEEHHARHKEDLKAIRRTIGDAAAIGPMTLRHGMHAFDLTDSDWKDPVVPQDRLVAYAEQAHALLLAENDGLDVERLAAEAPDGGTPAGTRVAAPLRDPTEFVAWEAERPIADVMREETGCHFPFAEIRETPTYFQEQVRAVGRELLLPHIGDFPMERVSMALAPSRDPESYATFMGWFRDGELVKDVEPMTHPSMPGYRTSEAQVYRRDGWDALIFSDGMAGYAYAWPTHPDLTPAPGPGM